MMKMIIKTYAILILSLILACGKSSNSAITVEGVIKNVGSVKNMKNVVFIPSECKYLIFDDDSTSKSWLLFENGKFVFCEKEEIKKAERTQVIGFVVSHIGLKQSRLNFFQFIKKEVEKDANKKIFATGNWIDLGYQGNKFYVKSINSIIIVSSKKLKIQ